MRIEDNRGQKVARAVLRAEGAGGESNLYSGQRAGMAQAGTARNLASDLRAELAEASAASGWKLETSRSEPDAAGRTRVLVRTRRRPTLEVSVELDDGTDGTVGIAAVPSGASTGTEEAVERRDGDPSRYRGAGVRSVAGTVNSEAEQLAGRSWRSLAEVGEALCKLDGTPNKARLGADAIVGMAMARAQAISDRADLYRSLASAGVEARLPVPHFNVINGGLHAKNRLAFQEFLVAPLGALTFAEALRAGAEIYATLGDLLDRMGFSTGLGDEGGFAPVIEAPTDALDFLVEAIETSGCQLGREGVAIALDPAAASFRDLDGRYRTNGFAL